MPQSIPDNPTGDEFKKLKDDGTRYSVLHTVVGRHPRGTTVSARDLGPGAQIQRLLDVGAIAEAPREEPAQEEEQQPASQAREAAPVSEAREAAGTEAESTDPHRSLFNAPKGGVGKK